MNCALKIADYNIQQLKCYEASKFGWHFLYEKELFSSHILHIASSGSHSKKRQFWYCNITER